MASYGTAQKVAATKLGSFPCRNANREIWQLCCLCRLFVKGCRLGTKNDLVEFTGQFLYPEPQPNGLHIASMRLSQTAAIYL
jgi:hypothetical protein